MLQPEIKKLQEKHKQRRGPHQGPAGIVPQAQLQPAERLPADVHPVAGLHRAVPLADGRHRAAPGPADVALYPLVLEPCRARHAVRLEPLHAGVRGQGGVGIFGLGPYFNILPMLTARACSSVQQKMFMPPAADEQAAMQQKMMQYMMIFMGAAVLQSGQRACASTSSLRVCGASPSASFLPKPPRAAGDDRNPGRSQSPDSDNCRREAEERARGARVHAARRRRMPPLPRACRRHRPTTNRAVSSPPEGDECGASSASAAAARTFESCVSRWGRRSLSARRSPRAKGGIDAECLPATPLGPSLVVAGSLRFARLHSPLPCEIYSGRAGEATPASRWPKSTRSARRRCCTACCVALCRPGAGLAGPGEFTLRAFLAGRIDLTQAEAVLA